MSLASILGALTWKESFDDDSGPDQIRIKKIRERVAKKLKSRKKKEDLRGRRTQPARLVHHRDGTTTAKIKLAENFIIPLIMLSRESAIKQSKFKQSNGHQRCTGCRFNKDGYCQMHDFYLPSGGTNHTCNEWQRRR